MIEILLIVLLIVTFAHIMLLECQRKVTIEYLFRIHNELIAVKAMVSAIERKIEE
jgi:hypothetical protein